MNDTSVVSPIVSFSVIKSVHKLLEETQRQKVLVLFLQNNFKKIL